MERYAGSRRRDQRNDVMRTRRKKRVRVGYENSSREHVVCKCSIIVICVDVKSYAYLFLWMLTRPHACG